MHGTPLNATRPLPAALLSTVGSMIARAFGPDGPSVSGIEDVNRGRGVFSTVVRVGLVWPPAPDRSRDGRASDDRPATVVAKLPVDGPNGDAARKAGAYRREALAYHELLDGIDVDVPICHHAETDEHDGAAFLLEDLGPARAVDQLDGLDPDDAMAVADALARLHRPWQQDSRLQAIPIRSATVAGLPTDALARGVDVVRSRWADTLTEAEQARFAQLVDLHPVLAERFALAGPVTLCHGDPRADNLVFRDDGRAVLFDWQQIAVQFGEADLAWLTATSLDPAIRRTCERDLVAANGGDFDRYRLGFALPGLAVLLLAQRELTTEREVRFVATSLKRIITAVDDLDVAALAD